MTNDELNTNELSFCGGGGGAVVIELVFIVVIESIEYVNVLVIVNVVVSDELIALVLIILVLDIGVVECNDSTLPLVVVVASLIISEVFGLLLVPVTFSEVIEVLSIVVISLVFSLAVDDSVTVLTSPFRLDSVDGEEVVLEVLETLSDT